MERLTAVGSLVAGPVGPVMPELPDKAIGIDAAPDRAGPVFPLLVELDWAETPPELPETAMGTETTAALPPLPPPASPMATPEPPTARPGNTPRLTATPPGPATGRATPPLPPSPAKARMSRSFRAAPVDPDVAFDEALAPELATLMALPLAIASPVSPDRPELPEVASPPTAIAVPRIPVLIAVGLDVAAPVAPVEPELPETAIGADTADETAGPVFPVLVELDCDDDDPELPEIATGLATTLELPPEPPLALPTAMLEPPTATPPPTLTASPPPPATGTATPPLPPLPATAEMPTLLEAFPVEPEPEVDSAPAPELAVLLAPPVAMASPVSPELPEFPDVASACAAVELRMRNATTANAPARNVRRGFRKDSDFNVSDFIG